MQLCMLSVLKIGANNIVAAPNITSLRYIHNYEGNTFVDASTDVPESISGITKITLQLINLTTNAVIIEAAKHIHADNDVRVGFLMQISGIPIPNNIIAIRCFAEDALGNKSAYSNIEKRDLNTIFDITLNANKSIIKAGEEVDFTTGFTTINTNIIHVDWVFEVNGKLILFGNDNMLNTDFSLRKSIKGIFPKIEGITKQAIINVIITAENDEHILITKKFSFTYQP